MNSIYLIFAGLILWPNLASASKTFHCVCNSEGPNIQASIIDLTMSDVYSLPDQGLTTTTQSPVPIPVIVVPQPDNQANQDVINELNKQDSEFDKCQQLFQKETLAAHNNYRFIHHVNPLKSNLMLQKTALNYANYLASNDIFQHSGTQGMGENLAYVWSSRVNTLKDCSGIYLKSKFINWLSCYLTFVFIKASGQGFPRCGMMRLIYMISTIQDSRHQPDTLHSWCGRQQQM